MHILHVGFFLKLASYYIFTSNFDSHFLIKCLMYIRLSHFIGTFKLLLLGICTFYYHIYNEHFFITFPSYIFNVHFIIAFCFHIFEVHLHTFFMYILASAFFSEYFYPQTSMVALPRALWPSGGGFYIQLLAKRSKASDKNSGASFEWRASGAPKVNTIQSKNGRSQVDACLSRRGITTTYREIGSMRARSSVSPVSAVPYPWKSMHHRARDAWKGAVWKSAWAVFCLALVSSNSGQSSSHLRVSFFISGEKYDCFSREKTLAWFKCCIRVCASRARSSWQEASTIMVGVRPGRACIQSSSLRAASSTLFRSSSKSASILWARDQASMVRGTVPSTSLKSSSSKGLRSSSVPWRREMKPVTGAGVCIRLEKISMSWQSSRLVAYHPGIFVLRGSSLCLLWQSERQFRRVGFSGTG